MGLFNWLFARACKIVFDRVDRDRNGKLDNLEVEIAILHLYNMVNKRMPGWQDPPSRADIEAALKAYDKDNNGTLDPKEFEEFARQLMKNGPDMFFARVGKNAVVTTALVPATGLVVQKAVSQAVPSAGDVPLAVFAPVVGSVVGAVRGLLPF